MLISLFPLPVASIEARKTIGPCKFDILFTKSVPHILETIFLSLDYEAYKACLEVSTAWKELLTTESYLRKAKSVFQDEIDGDEWKLWIAASEGNVGELQNLSSNIFVDVNCVKGKCRQTTPLGGAAENTSHKDVIQLLLKRGAKPNIADKLGMTPLQWTARKGNRDVVQLLLDSGAKPNIADREGWTPLHEAASSGHKDIVQLLLKV